MRCLADVALEALWIIPSLQSSPTDIVYPAAVPGGQPPFTSGWVKGEWWPPYRPPPPGLGSCVLGDSEIWHFCSNVLLNLRPGGEAVSDIVQGKRSFMCFRLLDLSPTWTSHPWRGLGCQSAREHLPRMHKGLIPTTGGKILRSSLISSQMLSSLPLLVCVSCLQPSCFREEACPDCTY